MLKIGRIHIDYQTDPVGISEMPQFGWELLSDRRNVRQRAYHFQIAQDKAFKTLVYDSGRMVSSESAHIRPAEKKGSILKSARKYYVRVKAEDEIESTEWSESAFFITALQRGESWKAPFISAETDDSYKECSKGTYVRGMFTVSRPVREAFAFTTALGLYNFFLNGEKVGKDELTPGWTSYQKNLLYQTYEVTDFLKRGTNIAGAMLAPGWYKGEMGLTRARNNYGDQTGFSMELLLRYEDGGEESVYTGTQWQGRDSPVVFSEIYDGEIYDAHLEIPEWSSSEQPGGSWHFVEETPFDRNVLHAQSGARVQKIEELPARNLFITPKGERVLDFGQNMTGRIHVTAFGKPGDVIELRCFEVLDKEGNVYLNNLRTAKQTLKYIFAGEKTVEWSSCFTYMGFQYAQILSYPGEPKPENFTADTLHSEMEQTGKIETSDPLLDQLHHNILWGMKGNFLDVPTDCPQRDERLGWTGDAQIFCRTASYLMNTYTFYRKWLRDLAADQTPEGGVPHLVPNIEEGHTEGNWLLSQGPHSAAAWADAAVILPWTMYLMYGDKEILETQYESMKSWIGFMRKHSVDYIWNYRLQLGDWVALDAEEGSYFGATPNDLTCTAYFAYSTGLFAKAAKVLEKEEAGEYEELYRKIVEKFQNTFFDSEGNMTAQTQTAHIVALYFQITPKKYVEKTSGRLKELLDAEDGHLVTGFVGTPYFCYALSQNGFVKEAYALLLKEDYPSWLYQVKKGATTIWEHWDGLKPDGSMWSADMNSFNHYAYGAVGEWMYRVMAGIETDEEAPGFSHSVYAPKPGGGLTRVNAVYKSIYGEHRVEWQIKDNRVEMTVQIPPNTTASVRLDNAEKVLEEDGLDFREKEGDMEAEAGSGCYHICYERRPAVS